jgi:hypothetical protein
MICKRSGKMKKIFTFLLFVFFGGIIPAMAQDPEEDPTIQTAEIGFITKEANLTPEEAQKFWPIYNKYREEMKELRKQYKRNPEDLEFQQKQLDIKKRYHGEFGRALPQDKVRRVFAAGPKFREIVRRQWLKRQQTRPRQMRPARRF